MVQVICCILWWCFSMFGAILDLFSAIIRLLYGETLNNPFAIV